MPDPVTTVQSSEEIAANAEAQVGAEITSETAPLTSRLGSLAGREAGALSAIGTMFGSILPYVQGAAQNVQTSYDSAYRATQEIFSNATQRLNALEQQRAQQAQAMAQEMGGPVALTEFTAALSAPKEALASYAPNQLLHLLGQAQAGVQEANAFAGRVFPLMRTEQESQARAYFEEQRRELEEQIDTIRGTKTGRVNARLSELLAREREYDLQKQELALAKLKAQRDWEATKKSLAMEKERIALAKRQFGLESWKTKEDVALAKRQLTQQDRQFMKQHNLSEREYRLREKELAATEKRATQEWKLKQQENAINILDTLTSGGDTVERTVRREISKSQALLDPKNSYQIKGKWYKDMKVKESVGGQITDPNRLYQALIGYNIPKAVALNLVRQKLGTPEFTPGKTDYSLQQLKDMSFRVLRGVALQMGFTPDPKRPKTRQQFIDWILDHR